jgi:hypothetical protein
VLLRALVSAGLERSTDLSTAAAGALFRVVSRSRVVWVRPWGAFGMNVYLGRSLVDLCLLTFSNVGITSRITSNCFDFSCKQHIWLMWHLRRIDAISTLTFLYVK